MSHPLSVTVLVGSPGNDGTRTFQQLLYQSSDVRLAAIVPKRTLRRNRPTGSVSLIPTTERLVRLGQGCACCTVRGDLLAKVQRIARDQSADHILIQAAPHTDLMTLAKTFTVADETGSVLSDVARIGSLVTVINGGTFFSTLEGSGARALVERVELANVVILEGVSSLPSPMGDRVEEAIVALNTQARIVRADETELGLTAVQADQPFDLERAEARSAGLMEFKATEGTNRSVVRFQYQARRPFHPARLHALMDLPLVGLLRAQGTFWIASRPTLACSLDIAGASRDTSPEGMWWADVPEAERPSSPELARYLESIWHPEFGDRHNILSIVVVDGEEDSLRTRLDACLLSDEELAAPRHWPSMEDPFHWPAPMQ